MEKYKIDFENIVLQEKVPGFKIKDHSVNNKKLRLVTFPDKLFEKEWCKNGHFEYV